MAQIKIQNSEFKVRGRSLDLFGKYRQKWKIITPPLPIMTSSRNHLNCTAHVLFEQLGVILQSPHTKQKYDLWST